MLIVKGYKIEGTDILLIEDLLQKLQSLIIIQGHKLYTEQLANEIEMMFDDISLNVIQRPNIPIYDAARQQLDQRISNASGRGLPLPYNHAIQMAVFTHKDCVYVRLNTNNEKLVKALKKAPAGMKDFSLYDDRHDNTEQKAREAVWNEIMEVYSGERKPLVRQLIACEGADPTWASIAEKFHSRLDRIDYRVRYQQTNSLLNLLGMGQQIPPHKLLPYLDEALMLLDNDGIKADARRMRQQATQMIINITEELVKLNPNDTPIPT